MPPAAASRPPRPRWALRILAAAAAVWLLREAGSLLAPVVIAVVLTFVLAPLVRLLRRRLRLPEMVGAAVVVGALIATLVPLSATLAEPAALWWQRAPQTVAQLIERFDRLRASLPVMAPPANPAPPERSTRRGAAPPPQPAPADPVKERIASEGLAITGVLLNRGAAFGLSLAATVILLYFLLASEHWMLSRTLEAVPRRRARALVLGGVRAAQREIGHYLLAVGLINLGVGALTGLTMWWLDLPNPTLWGTLAALLNFVPYIGPLLVTALLVLAGSFAFEGLSHVVAPALAFLAIHAIESNLVSPWVVGRRLALPAISVFLSVMFWGWLWGIPGALIAVPILIGVRTGCRRTASLRTLCRFLDGDARPVPSLRSLVAVTTRVRRRRGAAPVTASEAMHGADETRVRP